MGETRRVAICGSYGGMNLGAEAILQVIARELRKAGPVDIRVISRRPEDLRRRHSLEAVNMTGLSRQEMRDFLEPLDLFILGGGGLLYDADAAEMYLRRCEPCATRPICWLIFRGS
jgi:polysaccharide pyruvyl transferase WcaK-like protein